MVLPRGKDGVLAGATADIEQRTSERAGLGEADEGGPAGARCSRAARCWVDSPRISRVIALLQDLHSTVEHFPQSGLVEDDSTLWPPTAAVDDQQEPLLEPHRLHCTTSLSRFLDR